MSRRIRLALRLFGVVAALLVVVLVAAMMVVRSNWFHEKVRQRIVAEVVSATGGQASVESFSFDWRELRAEVHGFVLRGTEPLESPPLFRADRLVVGLKIVSAFRRDVDIALLEVHGPSLSIEKDEEGNTNLPSPGPSEANGQGIVAPIIDLAVEEFRLTNGTWRYGRREGTFSFDGRDLDARASYETSTPGYALDVGWEQMVVRAPGASEVAFDAAIELTVGKDLLTVRTLELATEASSLAATGTVHTQEPTTAEFKLNAQLATSDLKEPLRLPVEPVGATRFKGSFEYSEDSGYAIEGDAAASGLAVHHERVALDAIAVAARVKATPGTIELASLTASTLDGTFSGNARVSDLKEFEAEGVLRDLSLNQIMPRVRVTDLAWNGALSGPVSVAGTFSGEVSGKGDLLVTPRDGGLPLQGTVSAEFDTVAGDVSFGPSRLSTGTSRIDFSGRLTEGIRLSVYTEGFEEILPAFRLVGASPPDPFPIALDNGVAQFGGLVTGVLDSPAIAGHVALGPFVYQGRGIEHGAADFDVASDRLRLRSLTLRHADTQFEGDLSLSLANWRSTPDSVLNGDFELKQGSIQTLLGLAGHDLPLEGGVTGMARLTGNLGAPAVSGNLDATGVTAYGEIIDTAEFELLYSTSEVRIPRATLRVGSGEVAIQGAYTPKEGSWKDGALEFTALTGDFRLALLKAVRKIDEGLDGDLEGKLSGEIAFAESRPRLTGLNGELAVSEITIDDRSIGQASIRAETRRNILVMRAAGDLRESRIRANAEWSLVRDSFGLGQVTFSKLTLVALRQIGLFGSPETAGYVSGSMDGEIGFVGEILKPSSWRGMAKVTRLEIRPESTGRKSDRDVTLRNSDPLLFSIEPAKISVESARLVSEDTDLAISGTLSYLRRNPWNLHLKGSADLAVLTAFREDLLAEGHSTVDAVVRGSLAQPQVNGTLDFENGSFYLRNLPNGIDQVNGSIRFNRTRATIERFTSRTGGGDLELGGFIGFGGDDWIYRLNARAQRIRVRYPEGVSMLLDADLDLTGSSTRSLLSGEARVTRAAFAAESDFASVLSDSANIRAPAEISNPFLKGMQFDLRIVTGSHTEFVTSVTRDIELEADLRLRGTVLRPVLLGRIGVNRGEIQFFGNRYQIMQGEVTFFNPVKIEPVVTMDLETRIRGYTVMMNFSGPLDKLNFSYRSDPPLQSQEIIALLTVGRAPGYAGSPSTSNPAGTSYFQAGGSSFLGHALTAPVSSRLQRFFGVSRIKIDPQLTGVDNTPETHVTIEQQVSRDITLTYVTNLAQTQQQIVRIEWTFHPDWSAYAVRDSNGVFGIDFVYRRRFK